ncbi:MAG: aspartate aminotransferase family protein [Lachnospiraceae bacterium]|nr:aspartate aminotransferase family protein [Lachnospiraceae bacterium]
MRDTIRNILNDDKIVLHPLQHSSTHAEPIIIERAENVWLYSITGEKILDAFSGMWNVNIGYGNKEMAQVAYDQMCKIAYGSNFSGSSTLPQINLAKKLSGYGYKKLKTTFFTSGGSEANESAFKTAQYYWKRKGKSGKSKFICLEGAYHGMTMAAASATGIPKFWTMFDKVPGFIHIPNPYSYRFAGEIKPNETVGQAAARIFEEIILKEGADSIAAFIAEPVQGSGGGIIPPDDYYPLIRKICDKHEILLIADEIVTGFGRTGKMFALENWGIEPDICSFAKGVTSGYIPLGGIQISDEINEVIQNAPAEDAWLHGFTYSGHAAACAVALKNIEIIERENLLVNATNMGAKLTTLLKGLLERECVGEIRSIGLLITVEFIENKTSREKSFEIAMEMYKQCLKRGVRVRALGNNVTLAPPYIINEDNVDFIAKVFIEALDECQGK